MDLQSYLRPIISAQVDGTAQTAASANSIIPAAAKATLPANFFSIGDQILIKASGRISVAQTTPGTVRFDVRFGANIVADSQAVVLDTAGPFTNLGWWLEFLLTCRAIGASTSANMMQAGIFTSHIIAGQPATPPKGALVAVLPWNVAGPAVGAGFDSTVSNTVDLFFTQTVGTGSCQLHQYSLVALQ